MKNYLIVGASSGIGKALANRLSTANKVIGTYNKTEPDDAMSDVQFVHFDVLSQDVSDLDLSETLDGIVYCPGSINLKPFNRFSEQDILDDIRLQVTGGLKLIQGLIGNLKKSEGASVVFVAIRMSIEVGRCSHTLRSDRSRRPYA